KYVRCVVGSEGFVPNAGWPYGYLLKQLRAHVDGKQSLAPESVCEWVVRDFLDFYRDYLPASVSVDIAACDLEKLDEVTKTLSTLSGLLIEGLTPKPTNGADVDPDTRRLQNYVILAHWRAQSFKREQNTDLWDFCDQLQKESCGDFDDIADACDAVKDAVEAVVGRRQGSVGIDLQDAHGLALYFPWSLPILREAWVLTPYSALHFPTASRWGEFIKTYVRQTRRELRKPEPAAPGFAWPLEDYIRAADAA